MSMKHYLEPLEFANFARHEIFVPKPLDNVNKIFYTPKQ